MTQATFDLLIDGAILTSLWLVALVAIPKKTTDFEQTVTTLKWFKDQFMVPFMAVNKAILSLYQQFYTPKECPSTTHNIW